MEKCNVEAAGRSLEEIAGVVAANREESKLTVRMGSARQISPCERVKINRFVILTRTSGPSGETLPVRIEGGEEEEEGVLSNSISHYWPAGGKVSRHSGELTRNNALAFGMLCRARNQVRPVMEIPGKFLSALSLKRARNGQKRT